MLVSPNTVWLLWCYYYYTFNSLGICFHVMPKWMNSRSRQIYALKYPVTSVEWCILHPLSRRVSPRMGRRLGVHSPGGWQQCLWLPGWQRRWGLNWAMRCVYPIHHFVRIIWIAAVFYSSLAVGRSRDENNVYLCSHRWCRTPFGAGLHLTTVSTLLMSFAIHFVNTANCDYLSD